MNKLTNMNNSPKVGETLTRPIFNFWSGLSGGKRDLLVGSTLVFVVLSIFAKTVFFAQPISRVSIVASRDVLFRTFCQGLPPGYDESVYLLVAPYYFLVSSYWRLGELPLWNPYSGWGAPFIGDIQSAAFSPLRVLFGVLPTMYCFNLLLVLEVAVAAVGMFLLARSLKLPRYATLFAGLTYAICPYTLHYLELLSGTSTAFMPLLFWLFVELGKQVTRLKVVVAAGACALFIFSGHPESSFVGISFASLLMVLLMATRPGDDVMVKKLTRAAGALALVGVITLFLTAPVLFSFTEFFLNSDCYKFGNIKTRIPSWASILYNFLQPAYRGASPFLGSFAVPLLLVSLTATGERMRLARCLMLTGVLAFLFTCRPGIVGVIFKSSLLNFVPGVYCLPVVLMSVIALCAYGLVECAERVRAGVNTQMLLFVLGIAVVLIIPVGLHAAGWDIGRESYDGCQPAMAFSIRDWINNVLILLSGFAALILFTSFSSLRPLLVCTLVALSFWSQSLPARFSMPIQSHFEYQKVDPVPFLAKQGERVLALGFDVLSPNNNFIFRISSIGVHNVMVPDRYLDFMRAAGAKITLFNIVVDKVPLSRLIDLAGIRYVVSLAPVMGEADAPVPEEAIEIKSTVDFGKISDLKLARAAVGYDTRKSEIWGTLGWLVKPASVSRYVYSVVLTDEKGRTLWYGGLNPIQISSSKKKEKGLVQSLSTRLVGLVPQSLRPGDKFRVGVQVFDSRSASFLRPIENDLKTYGSVAALKTFTVPVAQAKTSAQDEHYKLISESLPQYIRVYENRQALPQAYVARRAIDVATGDEALKRIQDKSFDPRTTVVVERISSNQSKQDEKASDSTAVETRSARVTRPSPQEVVIDAYTPEDGYLVLTDMHYPGWQATIDGKQTSILRANYLFRAVEMPKGRHIVRFVYIPAPFYVGVVLALIALFSCVAVLTLELRAQLQKPDPKEFEPLSKPLPEPVAAKK